MSNSIKKCPTSEHGYYTRESDGASGMTVTALADFCGTSQPAVTNLLNRVRESDPFVNDLQESLKPFAGKEPRSYSIDKQGSLLVKFEACKAIFTYFACHARKYDGQEICRLRFAQFNGYLAQGLTVSGAFAKTLESTKNLSFRSCAKAKRVKVVGREYVIQKRLKKEENGKTNVVTPIGYIDLLTEKEVIEIKEVSQWKQGVGQLVCYALYYPTHTKRIHLLGDAHEESRILIEKCCFQLNIKVTWEQQSCQ